MSLNFQLDISQPEFTCLKLLMETLEQRVKSV